MRGYGDANLIPRPIRLGNHAAGRCVEHYDHSNHREALMRYRPAAAVLLTALAPVTLAAQSFCPTGRFQPDFGWRTTACGHCAVYGSYLEYADEPKIGGIVATGPGAGKL